MTTTSFKRQYLFLVLLILTGLLVALSTLIGVDQRIGWIAAGFTIGVQVAIHMLRSAEMRLSRTVKEMSEESVESSSVRAAAKIATRSPLRFHASTSSRDVARAETRPAQPAATVVQLRTTATEKEAPVRQPAASRPSASCACACGCELNSDGGFEGLCRNCRSSRLQEVMACECDYSSVSACTCGVITHWPTSVGAGLIAVG